MRRTLLCIVAALLGMLVLVACSEAPASTGDKGYISGKGVITVLPAAEREEPGTVNGETLAGEPIALSDFAGKTVVVNVWGSWCPPCRAEAADLVAAANQLPKDEVAFLGINSRDLDPANAKAFVRRFDVPYPSIYDQGGKALLGFRGTLTANSIPSTVIVDEQGRVAARVLGEITEGTLLDLVEEVRQG